MRIFLILIIASIHNITFAQEGEISLELLWQTDGFDRPESLHPSEDGKEIYVSNINEDSRAIDGNGYISRLDLNGNILEKKWITGLNGPKGFAVENGTLYISDITHIVLIDVKSGDTLKRIEVPEPGFLNDLTVKNGRVFLSDTDKGILYTYTEEEGLSALLPSDQTPSINGLLPMGDKLLVTKMGAGELLSVDPETKAIDIVGSGIVRGDGIGILGNGEYIITSFSGEIYHIESADKTTLLLDSKPEKISQNDSYYIGGVLYVANLSNDRVTAWKVNR
jgi:DNA-binding beta-propeller fold protein YncE